MLGVYCGCKPTNCWLDFLIQSQQFVDIKRWINTMYLSDKQVTAIKRKRGELNLSIMALGRELGLSRWTLDNIFKRNHRKVTPATYKKISDWLIDEYATADIKDSTTAATQDK